MVWCKVAGSISLVNVLILETHLEKTEEKNSLVISNSKISCSYIFQPVTAYWFSLAAEESNVGTKHHLDYTNTFDLS